MLSLIAKIPVYRKFIVALLGFGLVAANTFFGWGDGSTIFGHDAESAVNAVISFVTAIGVYVAPNKPTA